MRLRYHLMLAACVAGGMILTLPSVSQTPDSARWRIYLTVTDSLTGKAAQAALGLHPRATLGLDTFLMSGFQDHWTENDSSTQREFPSPPLGFFQELRVNNVRQKFNDNGLVFHNIHRYTGPSMADTFIISFNGNKNLAEDSLFLYTHPQILSWPSVLRFYADSIILRDISDVAQTSAGPYVRVDMTQDSTYTYFGDNYFDPNSSTFKVDPLNKGFFMYIYHPKISPGPPVVMPVSPPNGLTNRRSNDTLRWAAVPGALYYKVQLDTMRAFSHPIFTDSTLARSKAVTGLHRNPWYYWRVRTANSFGVGYYQDPPDSFAASPGAISGIVFNDVNGNGLKDPGDNGLVSWRVLLKDPSDTIIDSTLTDATGNYHFSGLTAGAYTANERQQDAWIQTAPPGLGIISVAISKGDSSAGNDFGNVLGVQYTGPPMGNWSNPSNWAGGQVPGPTTPAIIPANATVVLDPLSTGTILYLRVLNGGTLTCPDQSARLTVTKSIQIDPGGVVDFPLAPGGTTVFSTTADSAGFVDYADFINKGTFNPGHSIVTFAGNKPKIIMSTQAKTPGGTNFYDLEIAGDSVTVIGNMTILHQLNLGYSANQRLQDTVTVTNDSTTAITGNGRIPAGTIKRSIRQSETGSYRFESPDTYLKFDGSGTYPSNVAVTTLPDTAPPAFHLKWQLAGGVVDTVHNTVRAASVRHFSKWAVGEPRPDSTGGVPVVRRTYAIKSSGGGGAQAAVQLRYEQTEVPPATTENNLQLLRGPVVIDSLTAKWNMISLPLVPDEDRKDSLFPAASTPAFAYEGGYVVQPNLRFGQGYWLRFPAAQQIQIVGNDVERETLAVSAGWNLIGTVSFPQPTASVGSIPPGIITSRFFGYAGGYRVADSLKPLRAYWVKVSTDGQLILAAQVSNAKAGSSSSQAGSVSSLLFRDAGGNEQKLYFGSNRNADPRQFELPPLPPEGAFDVRYSTQRLLELREQGERKNIAILISSAVYPVAIRWAVQDASDRTVLQVDRRSIVLRGQGEIELTGAATQVHLLLSPASVEELPRDFALKQNYPNPFNPATVIEYQLPVASNVTLKIYNLLGQELGTLVAGMQEPGFKSIEWNATGIASGIYFYRLQATSSTDPSRSFTQVRKMLLLR